MWFHAAWSHIFFGFFSFFGAHAYTQKKRKIGKRLNNGVDVAGFSKIV